MPSAKGSYPAEAISAYIYLPPEEVINQVGDSAKVSNSISWKYLTGFMLDEK